MKNIFTSIIALLLATMLFAQVPQGISYQAIAFTAGGTPVANGNVGVKISILNTSATGTVVYSETHSKTTNAQGLFNLNIGQGTATSGTFANINWASGPKFLKVELDPAGGSNYTTVGTNQLMSVPFALVAGSVAGSSSGSGSIYDQLLESKSTNFGFDDGYDSKMYVFNAATGTWSSQTYNPSGSPVLHAFNGNFYFDDGYDSKFYVWSSKTGQWSAQSYNASGSPNLVVDTLSGNYAFRDGYDKKIYVYNIKTGIWSSQTYNANGSPNFISSNGNFGFNDGYDNMMYVYSAKTGTWSPQSYNASGSPVLHASNGNFYFKDSYDNKMYVFSAKTGMWSSQTYNASGSPNLITSDSN